GRDHVRRDQDLPDGTGSEEAGHTRRLLLVQARRGKRGRNPVPPLEEGRDLAHATPAASASSSGVYSIPCASATASYVRLPPVVFTPRASSAFAPMAPGVPCSASCSTYGSVTFVRARVDVIGTAPGMFATQ